VRHDKPGPRELNPFPATHGDLLTRAVVPVTIRFAADADEGGRLVDGLEDYQYLDGFDGREYRMVVRRRSNTVLSARVPVEKEPYDPPSDQVSEALDAAERCLTAKVRDDA
jgi:hypothetical protein